jgi:tRNA G46 methylase TrmB
MRVHLASLVPKATSEPFLEQFANPSSPQLTKMFFLFPDPHFKRSKHKARIITYVGAV